MPRGARAGDAGREHTDERTDLTNETRERDGHAER
jgi:hypothetical protein